MPVILIVKLDWKVALSWTYVVVTTIDIVTTAFDLNDDANHNANTDEDTDDDQIDEPTFSLNQTSVLISWAKYLCWNVKSSY